MVHTNKIDFFKTWDLVSYRNARAVVDKYTLITLEKTIWLYLLSFGQEKSDKVRNPQNLEIWHVPYPKIDFFGSLDLKSYQNARGVMNSHTLITPKKTVLW